MALVPLLLSAGSVSAGGKEPIFLRIERDAALRIGTELVRFVYAAAGDRVYYLAARASDVNPGGVALRFPLSVALPGHKQFAGPGLYMAHGANGQWIGVLVQVDERDPSTFAMETLQTDEVELIEHARARGLDVFRVGEKPDEGDYWEGAEELVRRETRSTVRKAILVCMTVTLVFGGVTGGAAVTKASLEPLVVERREDARAAVALAVETVNRAGTRSQPKALADLDRLVAIAAKEQGRVTEFKSEGGETAFTFEVPLSADFTSWQALGPLKNTVSEDGQWRVVTNDKGGRPTKKRSSR